MVIAFTGLRIVTIKVIHAAFENARHPMKWIGPAPEVRLPVAMADQVGAADEGAHRTHGPIARPTTESPSSLTNVKNR